MVNAVSKYARQYAAIIILLVFMAILGIWTGGDVGQMQAKVNDNLGDIVGLMATVLLFKVPGIGMPLVVIVLAGGAVFFTLRFAFINVRGIWHAVEIVKGDYDDPDDEGEVSHFQALSSALSATVGLGNIAGVAVAVAVGGPGAVFWMMFTGFFGMASKFAECTLGQMYRQVDEEGQVRGGPMVYLRDGLAEKGMPGLGKVLSVFFAILCIGGSFGGGNMFQANQSFEAIGTVIPALAGERASGTVHIFNPTAIDLAGKKHLVRFKSKDGQVFHPTADIDIKVADWADYDGMVTTKVEAAAAGTGEEHNIEPKQLDRMELAVVVGRDVFWPKDVEASLADLEKKIAEGGEGVDAAKEEQTKLLGLKEKMAPTIGILAENPDPLHGGSEHLGWLYGLLLAVLVGIVIVGGIKRIGNVADKIVPLMCVLYVLSSLAIIILNIGEVPHAISLIMSQAFSPDAMYGGFIGVFVTGIQRAAFSSEAGVGSAAIAHSAARTHFPVREGLVALLEPFIDTLVICFMTGMVIIVTGVYADPATAGLSGVSLTAAAFESGLASFAGILLSVAVILFAFSTMISWSYYGERCWSYLFGPEQTQPYRYLFCFFVWLGCVSSMQNVLDFSDLMILSMAFPNIIGVVLLSPKISEALNEYWSMYKSGEMKKAE